MIQAQDPPDAGAAGGSPADDDAGAGPGGTSPFARIAVVGCGLIGGSFALASRGVDGVRRVTAWDVDPAVRREAAELDVADRVPEHLDEAVAGADLILLAVPVGVTGDVAARVVAAADGDAVLTDVGSVKVGPVEAVESVLAERDHRIRFLGGHPMAGSEQAGVAAADASLFQGATWLLTPTGTSDPEVFNVLSAHLRSLDARVLAVSPADHDRIVATASHLPQVVASALADEADAAARSSGDGVLAVAAGGFRDVTRIASSDPQLWTGILAQNREAVLAALESFGDRLAGFREAVAAGDWDTVRERLEQGRAARGRLPTKRRAGELVELVVPIPDRPGMLAEVTTALGAGGVNIEDLAMRHAEEAATGALVVAVSADAADRAADVLDDAGFASHRETR